MRYDITVITKDSSGLKKAKELIGSHGTIISQREGPERPFKYQIGQLTGGSYATYVVEIERPKMVELHRAMNLDDEIIRSLVVHHQAVKQLGHAEVKPEASVPVSVELKPETPITPVLVKNPEPKKVVRVQKKVSQVSEKERLKLLDEQLKKLLEE